MNLKTLDKRSELQIPRYPETLLKTAAKNVTTNKQKKNIFLTLFEIQRIPGPGQYFIKRALDPEPSKSDITGLDFERPGFGSQSNVISNFFLT